MIRRIFIILLACFAVLATTAWAEPLSDAAYMQQLVMAFLDGETVVTPENNTVTIRTALVRVAEPRTGIAQWYIDGVAREDYRNESFTVYNGVMSQFELTVPMGETTPDGTVSVALEITVGDSTRRMEKQIAVKNYPPEWYREQEILKVYERVQPMDIGATVRYDTPTYTDKNLTVVSGQVTKGMQVVYTDHHGTKAASIWIPEEARLCWVPYGSIAVSGEDFTVTDPLTATEKELFVNAKGYDSITEYLVWVHPSRQTVDVFQGSKGSWKLIQSSPCATGANITPTPVGEYTYQAYGSGWFHDTYYVKPVLYINTTRGIALHSILFNPDGTVQDGTLGKAASHGCIRMPLNEVTYLAEYLPLHTTVIVF